MLEQPATPMLTLIGKFSRLPARGVEKISHVLSSASLFLGNGCLCEENYRATQSGACMRARLRTVLRVGWICLFARTKRNLILRIVGSPTTLDRKQPIYDIVSVEYSSSAFSHATAQPSLMMKRWFLLALSLEKLFPSHPL